MWDGIWCCSFSGLNKKKEDLCSKAVGFLALIKIEREPVSEVATRRLENSEGGRGKLKCDGGGGQVRDIEGQNRVTGGMGSRGIKRET